MQEILNIPKLFISLILCSLSIVALSQHTPQTSYSGATDLPDWAKEMYENPGNVKKDEFDSLLKEGFSHGEILEINQVVSYFNYANRTVLGLGCSTDGDILGLSPGNSADPSDWSHN